MKTIIIHHNLKLCLSCLLLVFTKTVVEALLARPYYYYSAAIKYRRPLAYDLTSANSRNGNQFALNVSYSETARQDSLEAFEEDIGRLLKEYANGIDLSLPKLFRDGRSCDQNYLSYTNIWNGDMWERHISRKRYLRYVINVLNPCSPSRLLRMIAPQLAILGMWCCLCLYYTHSKFGKAFSLSVLKLRMPLSALSILSSFLAALLALRTNNTLNRVAEGRLAWGRCILLTRDIAQSISAYIYPIDKTIALLAARNLSLFGWLLKARLREDASDDVVRIMLSGQDAEYVISARKRPVAVISRLRQIVATLARKGLLQNYAALSFDEHCLELNRVYALDGSGLPVLLNFVTTLAAGFVMMGLDEISHQTEQPFRIMPMQPISAGVTRDVADAIISRPPMLAGFEDDVDGYGSVTYPFKPSY